jgi:hypothetical protein
MTLFKLGEMMSDILKESFDKWFVNRNFVLDSKLKVEVVHGDIVKIFYDGREGTVKSENLARGIEVVLKFLQISEDVRIKKDGDVYRWYIFKLIDGTEEEGLELARKHGARIKRGYEGFGYWEVEL